jgi:hypothetical protein
LASVCINSTGPFSFSAVNYKPYADPNYFDFRINEFIIFLGLTAKVKLKII